jgi:hypothetical protein
MAYFAKLNDENIVLEVISINNNELLDNGVESENKGIEFCKKLYGQDTKWKQTSYNTKAGIYYNPGTNTQAVDQSKSLRKNFAGIGWIYDEALDCFKEPKLYDSWIFNSQTGLYDAPVPIPQEYEADGRICSYEWNESIVNWVKVNT